MSLKEKTSVIDGPTIQDEENPKDANHLLCLLHDIRDPEVKQVLLQLVMTMLSLSSSLLVEKENKSNSNNQPDAPHKKVAQEGRESSSDNQPEAPHKEVDRATKKKLQILQRLIEVAEHTEVKHKKTNSKDTEEEMAFSCIAEAVSTQAKKDLSTLIKTGDPELHTMAKFLMPAIIDNTNLQLLEKTLIGFKPYPKSWYCPVSYEIMADPVIASTPQTEPVLKSGFIKSQFLERINQHAQHVEQQLAPKTLLPM